ncbi:MAG: hypothetical protein LCH41_05090 [Armatimonadetes bacterium]|nr:hypothetical protein [Armatimonadota bacterium]
MASISEIADAIIQIQSEIRDYINVDGEEPLDTDSSVSFQALLSALDVLGDTTLALSAASSLSISWKRAGASYIHLYGVYQAIELQISALDLLSAHFTYERSDNILRESQYLRDLRILVAGHPIFRIPAKKRKAGSSGISRVSMSGTKFTLADFIKNESVIFTQRDFADDSRRCLENSLTQLFNIAAANVPGFAPPHYSAAASRFMSLAPGTPSTPD